MEPRGARAAHGLPAARRARRAVLPVPRRALPRAALGAEPHPRVRTLLPTRLEQSHHPRHQLRRRLQENGNQQSRGDHVDFWFSAPIFGSVPPNVNSELCQKGVKIQTGLFLLSPPPLSSGACVAGEVRGGRGGLHQGDVPARAARVGPAQPNTRPIRLYSQVQCQYRFRYSANIGAVLTHRYSANTGAVLTQEQC